MVWFEARPLPSCFFLRQETLLRPTSSLSTQVYEMSTGDILLGYSCGGLLSHPGVSRNTLRRFMLQKPDYVPAVEASLAHVRLYLH